MKFNCIGFVTLIALPRTSSWLLPQRSMGIQTSINELLKHTESHDFSKLYVSNDLTTIYSIDKVTGMSSSTIIHPIVSQKLIDQALQSETPMYFLSPQPNLLPDILAFSLLSVVIFTVIRNSIMMSRSGNGGSSNLNMFGLGESLIQVLSDSYNNITGNIEALTDPKQQLKLIKINNNFFETITYPIGNMEMNIPSIPSREIIIPLNFNFTKHPSLSLLLNRFFPSLLKPFIIALAYNVFKLFLLIY